MAANRNRKGLKDMGVDLSKRSYLGRAVLGGIVAIICGVTSVAASAQSVPQGGVLDKLRKAGVVKIALVNAPPYGTMSPDGTVGGLGPTVVKTIMARLGVPKVEGVISTYGELIPGLMAGRWDIIGATMTITPARCQQVTFSDPEFIEGLGFAYVPADVPSPPKSIKEIGEKLDQIGVKSGSNELAVMQASAAAGRKGTVSQFPDNAAMLEGLQSKRVQLVVGGVMVLRAERDRRNNGFEVIYPMPDDILRDHHAHRAVTVEDLTGGVGTPQGRDGRRTAGGGINAEHGMSRPLE